MFRDAWYVFRRVRRDLPQINAPSFGAKTNGNDFRFISPPRTFYRTYSNARVVERRLVGRTAATVLVRGDFDSTKRSRTQQNGRPNVTGFRSFSRERWRARIDFSVVSSGSSFTRVRTHNGVITDQTYCTRRLAFISFFALFRRKKKKIRRRRRRRRRRRKKTPLT